jgi:ribonuclease Z
MIKITFLGTSGTVPTVERNHTSMLLEYKGENILVDCGEGTQRQFRKAKLNPCKITKILITHCHGDHILGLSGLLQTLGFNDYNKKLIIYGPKGIREYVKLTLQTFAFHEKFPIEVKEAEGKFFENEDFYLEAKPMTHGIPCNAYSFNIKDKIRIDKAKLKKTHLNGPVLKNLKEGKDISFEGKKYLAKNLTYKEEGKKVSLVLDTSFNAKIVPFAENSDLLICEATFDEDSKEKANEYKHLTSSQAAEIAKKSKSKKLILTHIGQIYSKNPKKLLDSAKKIFKNSVVAEDFGVFEI